MKVKTAMHRGVQWFAPNTPILDIARAMKAGDIGAVPIGEDDRLVGMVTDRDITCKAVAAGTDLSKVTARDVMSQGIVFCRENESVADAAQLMESRKIRRLPVINKNKRMGIDLFLFLLYP